ncbi:hypothetical protein U9M48_025671, partial [Paspalum notatum var. saurae]
IPYLSQPIAPPYRTRLPAHRTRDARRPEPARYPTIHRSTHDLGTAFSRDFFAGESSRIAPAVLLLGSAADWALLNPGLRLLLLIAATSLNWPPARLNTRSAKSARTLPSSPSQVAARGLLWSSSSPPLVFAGGLLCPSID